MADEFAGEDPLERLNKLTPPPVPGATHTNDDNDGDETVAPDLAPGAMPRGPLTVDSCREELQRVEREVNSLRVMLQQAEREREQQKQRQAAALREVERVEERLEYHSREEIRSVYILASEAEMRTFMVSEQLDQVQSKLQAFERYEHFLRGAVESLATGVAPTLTAVPPVPTSLEMDDGVGADPVWRRPTTPLQPVAYQEPDHDAVAVAEDTANLEESVMDYTPSIEDLDEPESWVGPLPTPTFAPAEDWRKGVEDEAAEAWDEMTVVAAEPAIVEEPAELPAISEAAQPVETVEHTVAAVPTEAVELAPVEEVAQVAAPATQEPEPQPVVTDEPHTPVSVADAYWTEPASEPYHQPEMVNSGPEYEAPVRATRAKRRRSVRIRLVPVEMAAPEEAPQQQHAVSEASAPAPVSQTAQRAEAPNEVERGVVVMGPRTAALAYDDGSRSISAGALNRIVQAQEEMAERVARQMQNGPVQSLMNLAMEASLYEQMAEASPEAAMEGLHHLRSLVNTIVQEHAQSLLALRPLGRGERSFIGAIRRYGLMLSAQHQVSFEFLAPHGERQLPADVATPVFRIVQEALLNAALHSRASLVLVTVDFLPDRLTVEVEDDGVGFEARSVLARAVRNETGGIMGMLERAEMLGGWMRVESMPGKGCLVEFSMPLGSAS